MGTRPTCERATAARAERIKRYNRYMVAQEALRWHVELGVMRGLSFRQGRQPSVARQLSHYCACVAGRTMLKLRGSCFFDADSLLATTPL